MNKHDRTGTVVIRQKKGTALLTLSPFSVMKSLKVVVTTSAQDLPAVL